MPLWSGNFRDYLKEIRLESGVFAWVLLALVAVLFLAGIIWILVGL